MHPITNIISITITIIDYAISNKKQNLSFQKLKE